LQTLVQTCGKCLAQSVMSFLDVSVITCHIISLPPVVSSHMQHRPCQLLWVCSWLPVCVCHFPSHLPKHTSIWQQCSMAELVHHMFPVIICDVVHIIHMHLDFDDAALFIIPEPVFRAPPRDMMINTTKEYLKEVSDSHK
jgi:hypothetical protein